jgi:hypothetical protein
MSRILHQSTSFRHHLLQWWVTIKEQCRHYALMKQGRAYHIIWTETAILRKLTTKRSDAGASILVVATKQRVADLESVLALGHLWYEEMWLERLRELGAYKKQFKTCLVAPQSTPSSPSGASSTRQYRLFLEGKPSPITARRIPNPISRTWFETSETATK